MKLAEALPSLLAELRRNGLDPDRLEPWAAWKAFKTFLRQPIAAVEDACYVEFGTDEQEDGFWHLRFVRQLAVWERELQGSTPHPDDQPSSDPDLNVVREIVLDLAYDPARDLPPAVREIASGEYATAPEFIAVVESDSAFQAGMAAESVGSLVYAHEV